MSGNITTPAITFLIRRLIAFEWNNTEPFTYVYCILPVSFRRIRMKGEGKALQGWRILLPKIRTLASQLLFQPTEQGSRDLWAGLLTESLVWELRAHHGEGRGPVLRIRDVYPGSRILIFTHPGSRIQKQPQKRGVKKKFLSYLFM